LLEAGPKGRPLAFDGGEATSEVVLVGSREMMCGVAGAFFRWAGVRKLSRSQPVPRFVSYIRGAVRGALHKAALRASSALPSLQRVKNFVFESAGDLQGAMCAVCRKSH
jgi:hypothetical protein